MDRGMDRRIGALADGQMGRRIDKSTDPWIKQTQPYGFRNGWTDKWMDRRMDGQMDGQAIADGRMYGCNKHNLMVAS